MNGKNIDNNVENIVENLTELLKTYLIDTYYKFSNKGKKDEKRKRPSKKEDNKFIVTK